MTDEKTKAVLRALKQLSKESELSINELRVLLALERLAARLEAHKTLREKLIFKGGFVLMRAYNSNRFTRDLDALAVETPKEVLVALVQEAVSQNLADSLFYGELEIQDLIDQGRYGGYRIKIPFQIGSFPTEPNKIKKLSRIHLDIGFGDVITTNNSRTELKPLLSEQESFSWKIYPLETIFAEKLETLVSRASANSRGKDLYDISIIFEQVKNSKTLLPSIKETFTNRETVLPESFLDFFNTLDLTILRNSWGAVDLQGEDMSFEECIDKLGLVLKYLDDFYSL